METYALTTATYQRRALFVRSANAELLVKMLFHYRDQGRYTCTDLLSCRNICTSC
jgi:hypothetical protein